MANTKTAKENILINKRNQRRNLHFKSRMKSYIVNAQSAISNNASEKETLVKEALRIIDKTSAKGVITKKIAARKKSRLSLSLNRSKNGTPDVSKKPPSKHAKKKTTSKTSTPKKAAEAKKASSKETTKDTKEASTKDDSTSANTKDKEES
ncbi:MAG: 30S ribosomal protein S20 [Candidatus Margulisbacteria bacterium]|nr:30S ribosomal protein S20 [Candidatus Margulisiibacteriota bacterium]